MVVAVLSCLATIATLTGALVFAEDAQPDDIAWVVQETTDQWLLGIDYAEPELAGHRLAVDEEGVVLFATGSAACRRGDQVETCAPRLAALETTTMERHGDERWALVRWPMADGRMVLAEQQMPDASIWLYAEWLLPRTAWALAVTFAASLPAAVVIALFTAQPLGRRLSAISAASRRFASGDEGARNRERGSDEIGQLGRQFDAMADGLERHLTTLRGLAAYRADTVNRAEAAAIRGERTRVARDLHDGLAQDLFALGAAAAPLPGLVAAGDPRAAERASMVAELSTSTLVAFRRSLVDLRPRELVADGLAAALAERCREWEARTGVPVQFSAVLAEDRLPFAVEEVAYFVAREALANAARHARPTVVAVSLVAGRNRLTLSVTNDGVPSADEQSAAAPGWGLANMRERARALGGSVEVGPAADAEPPGGAWTVRLSVPLVAEGSDG